MEIALGLVLLMFGVALVAATFGKPKDWVTRLGGRLPFYGWPRATASDKVRAFGYIASASGFLELIRALWFRA